MSNFRYNLQFAHFDANQVEDRGYASPRDIKSEFNSFDWAAQVQEAQQRQKCSPTIAVRNVDSGAELGLSAIGEPSGYAFLVFYFYEGIQSHLLGLVKRPGKILAPNVELSKDDARELLELFLEGDHESIMGRINDAK